MRRTRPSRPGDRPPCRLNSPVWAVPLRKYAHTPWRSAVLLGACGDLFGLRRPGFELGGSSNTNFFDTGVPKRKPRQTPPGPSVAPCARVPLRAVSKCPSQVASRRDAISRGPCPRTGSARVHEVGANTTTGRLRAKGGNSPCCSQSLASARAAFQPIPIAKPPHSWPCAGLAAPAFRRPLGALIGG